MFTKWTQHLKDPDEVTDFTIEIKSARRVLERLADILKEDLASIEKVEISPKVYDLPNWEHRQAHSNGIKFNANRTISLITNLDQQETK